LRGIYETSPISVLSHDLDYSVKRFLAIFGCERCVLIVDDCQLHRRRHIVYSTAGATITNSLKWLEVSDGCAVVNMTAREDQMP
jgi:hypothetical protein